MNAQAAETTAIPDALRTWFVIHFVADVVYAVPLFIAPEWFLGMLGWESVDPVASRLVAAALFGIGVESWLGRNQGYEGYVTMLRLKVIWSATATIGIFIALMQGAPLFGWGFFAIFAAFHVVWHYWFRRLTR